MASCWTISLRELSLQSKQPRVAWILFAYLVITERKMQWTKQKTKRRKPDYTTQGSVVGWHYYRHTFFRGIVFNLSLSCIGFPCHRDVTSADCHLVVLSFTLSWAHRMNPCCKRTRVYHLLHLLPESLVQQSVSKGIDGRVKYYYRVRDRSC